MVIFAWSPLAKQMSCAIVTIGWPLKHTKSSVNKHMEMEFTVCKCEERGNGWKCDLCTPVGPVDKIKWENK